MNGQKLESIKGGLEAARAWEAKGMDSWRNIAWSNNCISSVLMNLLSLAVEEFSKSTEAAAWLHENDALSLLRRIHEHLKRLVAEVDADRIPASTFGGNYPHLVYAHMSWALEDFALGEAFVRIAERKDSAEISTPFWCDYAKGMGSLMRRQEYAVPQMKLRGQEQYWATYLYLFEAVARGGSLEEPLQRINQAFIKRNADKRIKDDNYGTEGSGVHPVKWDYRRDSLLAYVTRLPGDSPQRNESPS